MRHDTCHCFHVSPVTCQPLAPATFEKASLAHLPAKVKGLCFRGGPRCVGTRTPKAFKVNSRGSKTPGKRATVRLPANPERGSTRQVVLPVGLSAAFDPSGVERRRGRPQCPWAFAHGYSLCSPSGNLPIRPTSSVDFRRRLLTLFPVGEPAHGADVIGGLSPTATHILPLRSLCDNAML